VKKWAAGLTLALLLLIVHGHATSHTPDPALRLQIPPALNALECNTGSGSQKSLAGLMTKPAGSTASAFAYISGRELIVPEGVRLMVFSPHPDDESLAASGIIQRALENDGKICVVLVTNGDGYPEGVRARIKRAVASSNDFIEYGKKRQEEAAQALCELGLPREDVVFLGFPDDGIDDLWETYWSRLTPYTSPYTRFNRPYQKGRLSRWVKYAGVDLEAEIARVLNDFKPDWVVIPDPRDFHPDHATTGVFVLDALRKLNQEGEVSFASTQVFTYLVHFRDYPQSNAWAKEINKTGVRGSSSASKILSGTEWLSLPLTPAELDGKGRALQAHASQSPVLGYFFKSFVLPCELFGHLDSAQIMAVPQEYALCFKRLGN
jgi:LmbE family N-acetylglucosaminyl deacetylase